jgi:hypothetical protein
VQQADVCYKLASPQVQILNENAIFAYALYAAIVDARAVAQINKLQIKIARDVFQAKLGSFGFFMLVRKVLFIKTNLLRF